MPSLRVFVVWEVQTFLLALAAAIAIQLLSGQINTRFLLWGRNNDAGDPIAEDTGDRTSCLKREDTHYFSPARVQLLLFTLGAAFWYLMQVLNNPNPGTFPPLPASWPTILGGSNALYLSGKAYSRISGGNENSKTSNV